MRRNYSIVDLVRFAKLSQERVGEKPIDLLKEYDRKFPELTAKQKYENLLRVLGVEKATELERVLAKRLNENSNCNKPHVSGSLPSDKEVEDWFVLNIDNDSASSAIYKFRLWLEERWRQ